MLSSAPELQANMRITGLRGVGKSVLLDVFADSAETLAWEAAPLEFQPSHNTDASLGEAIAGLLEQTRGRLSLTERLKAATGRAVRGTELGLSWDEFSLTFSPGNAREESLAEDLFNTVELALARGRSGLVFLLDEAQIIRDERNPHGEHPLSLLLAPVVALQRREVPVALVVCGLPTLSANLQKARSYSERLFRGEEVDSLPALEAAEAFARPLAETSRTVDEQVTADVVEEVEGYPYFIQLWGSELWDAAGLAGVDRITPELLTATRPEIYRRVDLDFYRPRMAILTPAEEDVLLASVACPYPPLSSSGLGAASDKSSKNVNVLLGRLVEAGVLYRIRKGEYAYTAPKFREFLERRVEALEKHPG